MQLQKLVFWNHKEDNLTLYASPPHLLLRQAVFSEFELFEQQAIFFYISFFIYDSKSMVLMPLILFSSLHLDS